MKDYGTNMKNRRKNIIKVYKILNQENVNSINHQN